MGELGGDGGVGAALDLLGGLGVEPGGTVELAGQGDSSRRVDAPATTRRLIVSREDKPSLTGSLPADGGGAGGQPRGGFDTVVGCPVMLTPADGVWTLLPAVGAPP